jgi:hypothetical protein
MNVAQAVAEILSGFSQWHEPVFIQHALLVPVVGLIGATADMTYRV